MAVTAAWLVSAAPGDRVRGGVDIALLPDVSVLRAPALAEWMAGQGWGPGAADELMYVTLTPPPEHLPSRRTRLGREDAGRVEAALAEAEDTGREDAEGYARALADLRLYRRVTDGRDEIIRAALAAGISVNRVHAESGLSRTTIYHVAGNGPASPGDGSME